MRSLSNSTRRVDSPAIPTLSEAAHTPPAGVRQGPIPSTTTSRPVAAPARPTAATREARRRSAAVGLTSQVIEAAQADRLDWFASRSSARYPLPAPPHRAPTISSAQRQSRRSTRYASPAASMDATSISNARASRMSFTPGPGPRVDALMREDAVRSDTPSTRASASGSEFAMPTLSSVSAAAPSLDSVIGGQSGVRLEVVLDKDSPGQRIDMYGGPRTGTAYSLPGHVVIHVGARPAGSAPVDFQIKGLQVVFEGKCEYYDESGRYRVLRLCQVHKALFTDEPVFLPKKTADGDYLALAFDLVIPGWLPPTFDGEMSATSYGIIATGDFSWTATSGGLTSSIFPTIPPPSPSQPVAIAQTHQAQASRFTSLLTRSLAAAKAMGLTYPSPTTPPVLSVRSAWQPIEVARHRIPLGQMSCPVIATLPAIPTLSSVTTAEPEILMRHFSLKPSVDSPSPVECVVSTPEFVDVEGTVLRVSIRLRSRKSPMPRAATASQPCGLAPPPSSPPGTPPMASPALAGAEAPVDAPAADYFAPPQNAHTDMGHEAPDITDAIVDQDLEAVDPCEDAPLNTRMLELGMEVEESERYCSIPSQAFTSAFPLPEEQPDACNPSGGRHPLLSPPSRWADLASLGMAPMTPGRGQRTRVLLLGEDGQPRTYKFEGEGLDLGDGWRKVNVIIPMPGYREGRQCKPSSEMESPFVRIKHKLKIRVVCRTSAVPGQDTIVVLTTPLRLGTAPPPRPVSLPYMTGQAPLSPLSRATPLPLPAYAQLFSEIGQPRADEDILPAYTSHDSLPVVDFDMEAKRTRSYAGRLAGSRHIAAADATSSSRGGMDMDRSEVFRQAGSAAAAPSARGLAEQQAVHAGPSAEPQPKPGQDAQDSTMQDVFDPPSPFGGSADERYVDAHDAPTSGGELVPSHDLAGYPTLEDLLRLEARSADPDASSPDAMDTSADSLPTSVSASSSMASELLRAMEEPQNSLDKAEIQDMAASAGADGQSAI